MIQNQNEKAIEEKKTFFKKRYINKWTIEKEMK